MTNKEKYQGEKIFYQGKFRRVQIIKGWSFIFYNGKRIGVSAITKNNDIDLETVEGWQRLYEKSYSSPELIKQNV